MQNEAISQVVDENSQAADKVNEVGAADKRPILINLSMPFYPIKRPWTVEPTFMPRQYDPGLYVPALKREVLSSAPDFADCRIPAVWVGGCGPAGYWGGRCAGGIAVHMKDGELGHLLRDMREAYDLTNADDAPAEITLTAHPGMVATTAIELCRLAHATHLWVDFGSGNLDECRELGRFMGPDAMDVTDQIVSPAHLDLTFGLLMGIPGQTEKSSVHSIKEALRHGATAVSLSDWHLEPASDLSMSRAAQSEAWRENARHRIPTAEETALIRKAMEQRLTAEGMVQYLPNQWALPGHESRYLQLLAQGCEQLGFGLGARTRFDHVGATNTLEWGAYLNAPDNPEITIVERHVLEA